jgi:hypothetical protein
VVTIFGGHLEKWLLLGARLTRMTLLLFEGVGILLLLAKGLKLEDLNQVTDIFSLKLKNKLRWKQR